MPRRVQSDPRMSQAVVHGNTLYLAGQVAQDPTAGVAGQTREVLAAIDALLASASSNKSRIFSANVYLSDIATFPEMNWVWDDWVSKEHSPARATIEARLVSPTFKIEIQVIAGCDWVLPGEGRAGTNSGSRSSSTVDVLEEP